MAGLSGGGATNGTDPRRLTDALSAALAARQSEHVATSTPGCARCVARRRTRSVTRGAAMASARITAPRGCSVSIGTGSSVFVGGATAGGGASVSSALPAAIVFSVVFSAAPVVSPSAGGASSLGSTSARSESMDGASR